jgi:DNA-binding PadR family transcriptional regulator
MKKRRKNKAKSTPSGDNELTTPDLVVLSLLAEKPLHGYELNLELERREVRDWAGISRPQVYYSLNKLRRLRLIQPVTVKESSGGPSRQVFRVTGEGLEGLADSLERPGWATQRIPPPFLTWLALSLHARPGVASKQLEQRRQFLRAEIKKERETLKDIRKDTGPMTRVAELMVELTIRQFEVELKWLER